VSRVGSGWGIYSGGSSSPSRFPAHQTIRPLCVGRDCGGTGAHWCVESARAAACGGSCGAVSGYTDRRLERSRVRGCFTPPPFRSPASIRRCTPTTRRRSGTSSSRWRAIWMCTTWRTACRSTFLERPGQHPDRPLWAALEPDAKLKSKIYMDLAIEGVKARPFTFSIYGLQRAIASSNLSHLDATDSPA